MYEIPLRVHWHIIRIFNREQFHAFVVNVTHKCSTIVQEHVFPFRLHKIWSNSLTYIDCKEDNGQISADQRLDPSRYLFKVA